MEISIDDAEGSAPTLPAADASSTVNDSSAISPRLPSISISRLAKSTATPSSSSCIQDEDAFPQGCQFSPDTLCVLTARGHQLELYNTPSTQENSDQETNEKQQTIPWNPVLTYNHGGNSVRSYCWYPRMASNDAASCCFAASSREGPVHLYDAYHGSTIRATYAPYNRLDELESPRCIQFLNHGQHLLTGGYQTDRMLQVFDVARPGRSPLLAIKLGKTRRSKDGQKGLVSALAHNDATGLCAVGTVSPGSIYLYDIRTYCQAPVAEITVSTASPQTCCVVGHGKGRRKRLGGKRKHLHADNDDNDENADDNVLNFAAAKQNWYQQKTQTGVTQLEFFCGNDDSGTDSHYLFSASRRSNAILQWDLRKLSSSSYCPGIASFEIENDTNQRIEFQLHNGKLWTGGKDGRVRVYDVKTSEVMATLDQGGGIGSNDHRGFSDVVNGVSLCTNPIAGKTLLATAIGCRHFPTDADWEQDNPYDKDNTGGTPSEDATDTGSLQLFAVDSDVTKT